MTDRIARIQFSKVQTQDLKDLTTECYAYMKTKQFMAHRICEQQGEIETLKNQLFYHSVKHVQMYDMLKHLNEEIQILKNRKESENNLKDNINISADLVNSLIYDQNDDQNEKNDF